MEALERGLWLEYRGGCASAKERIVAQYIPLAQRIAKIIYARRFNNSVDFGDYLQLAYIGLLEAIERYSHDSTASFSTFATYRIRGSIFNGLTKMTEQAEYVGYLKRAQRDRTTSILKAGTAEPVTFSSMIDLVVSIALTHQLDDLLAEDRSAEEAPYASRSYDEIQKKLSEVVGQLPEREGKIISFHYFEEMCFEEIGLIFGITKGRVSQIHRQALLTIRELLKRQRIEGLY